MPLDTSCRRPSLALTLVSTLKSDSCRREQALLRLQKHFESVDGVVREAQQLCVSLQHNGELWELEIAHRLLLSGCTSIDMVGSSHEGAISFTPLKTCMNHIQLAASRGERTFAREVKLEDTMHLPEGAHVPAALQLGGRADFVVLLYETVGSELIPVLVVVECKSSPKAERSHKLQVLYFGR